MKAIAIRFGGLLELLLGLSLTMPAIAGETPQKSADPVLSVVGEAAEEKARAFLQSHKNQWRDLNIPEPDGQLLYDTIVKHNYKKALEIGTSTGHSGIWIAWALRKTGGRLVTVEIDQDRYREALAHFQEAGLAEIIDARRADAHVLVPELKGPFDFVFCDADKDWYKNYFVEVLPKLAVGGCFAAHNVTGKSNWGAGAFYEYALTLPFLETRLDRGGSGMSLSFKKADR